MALHPVAVDTLAAFYGDIGRELHARGISVRRAAKLAHFSSGYVGKMRNPKTGTLLRWSSIERVLRVCDFPDDLRANFQRRHKALSPEECSSPAPDLEEEKREQQPNVRKPWHPRWTVLVAVVGTAALLVGIGAWLNWPDGQPKGDGPSLVVLSAPSNNVSSTAGCTPETTWHTKFRPDYYGEVAVYVFSPSGVREADVHMTWGRFQRDDLVQLFPGDLTAKSGGTLWRAHKRNQGEPNPGLTVHASIPVCVEFGTASDSPFAPSLVIPADEGWY